FSAVRTVELPALSSLLQPRPAAALFAVCTLGLVGIDGAPVVAVAGCGIAAVLSAALSFAIALRRRRGAAHAHEALARGLSPSLLRRRLIRDGLERAVESPPSVEPTLWAPDRRRRTHDAGLRVVLEVELDVFEKVRRSAGQLLAERVIADTEERLRSVVRAAD